jgi:4-amino-4-deoxy-L-arabinose transferase-like glycosyltransferase
MLRELLENGSIIEIVATFVALGLIIATILSLVYIIVGGISFILSAGNEDKIKRSVQTIRFAIIGLFVSFIAFFVVRFITVLLDIPFELTFSMVIDLVRDIFDALQ